MVNFGKKIKYFLIHPKFYTLHFTFYTYELFRTRHRSCLPPWGKVAVKPTEEGCSPSVIQTEGASRSFFSFSFFLPLSFLFPSSFFPSSFFLPFPFLVSFSSFRFSFFPSCVPFSCAFELFRAAYSFSSYQQHVGNCAAQFVLCGP